jgi:hypothetical protein
MKHFSHVRLPCKSLSFLVLGFLSKKSRNHENLDARKIFMTIFEFIGQFFFQNVIYKLQKYLSELGIKVFLENGLGSFLTFLILQIRDKLEVL